MAWLKGIGSFILWIMAGISVLVVFTGMLWLTVGAFKGYPALIIAIAAFTGLGWMILNGSKSILGKSLRFTPITISMFIVLWAMIPLGPDEIFEFQPLPGQELWDLGDGRVVALTHHQPANLDSLKDEAILFVHGGPGAFVREFDRDFMASFTDFGYEVYVYDQVGAG
ncbi:MAG: hypothetical protein WD022_01925, partial [Balneolaceae bacterium]